MELQPSLVPADYVDATVYRAEVASALRGSWLPLCRADELASPGDRLARTVLGEPVVAVRGATGEVRVLSNVCRHRGATVADEGPGNGSTLVCPYHRWAYRLDGSLVGAPMADGVDLHDVCLPEVAHRVWEGFVLVNLSGDAREPDLAGLSALVAPWRLGDLVTVATRTFDSGWNWKVMVENWIECYHHIGTHRETIEPIQPARTTQVVDSGGAPWTAMTVDTVVDLGTRPEDRIPGLPEEHAGHLLVWAAFPLLLGGAVSEFAFWLHVQPLEAQRHTVTWHLLVHPERRPDPEAIDTAMSLLAEVHAEDMAACARVQAGLASGHLDRLRLVPLEAPIVAFQRWVAGHRAGAAAG